MPRHTREDGKLLHLYFGHMIVVIIGAAIPLAEPVRWKTWQRRIMRMKCGDTLAQLFLFCFSSIHTAIMNRLFGSNKRTPKPTLNDAISSVLFLIGMDAEQQQLLLTFTVRPMYEQTLSKSRFESWMPS